MTEAYKIGVTVAMTNLLLPELKKIGSALLSVHGQAKDLELTMASMAKIGVGVGLVAAVSALAAGVGEARKFQTEAAKFAALGFGDAVNQQAQRFAEGMNTLGTSATENMRIVREATAIIGDVAHGEVIAPMLAQMKFGLDAVMNGGEGEKFDAMMQAAIKVSELRGALVNRQTGEIDPDKFKAVLDDMVKAYVASGGLVKPQDYLAAIKTGGVSTKLMSDEMFFYGLGHFMQESGGTRTGTSSMSMFQNWIMGRMPQRVAEDLAKLGLLDKSALHYGTTGHITRVDAMGLTDAKDFIANPFKWVNEVAKPLLEKQGYHGDDLNIKLASLLGIRTASNLADQFVREQKIADLYVTRAQRAGGVDALAALGDKTLDGKLVELSTQWHNVLKNLGDEVLPAVIKGTSGLVGILKYINDFFGWGKGVSSGVDALGAKGVGAFKYADAAVRMMDVFGRALTGNSSVVPPAQNNQALIIDHQTVLDGRTIANSVTKYQIDGMATMPSSGSAVDGRMILLPVH